MSADGYSYNGIPLGSPTENNARVVRENAPDVASWRACFPGDAMVQLENGSIVSLQNAKIGDKVKVDVATNKYEAIYGFAKRKAAVKGYYLKISWKATGGHQNSFLEISSKHMLLASSGDRDGMRMIPASMVKLGDKIMVEHDENKKAVQVFSISTVRREGAFAPLTFSGTIVVNGCQASAYVSYQDEEFLMLGSGTLLTQVRWHWLAQTFLTPVRWIGTLIAAPLQTDILWWLPTFLESWKRSSFRSCRCRLRCCCRC